MPAANISRVLGGAERAMRALLERKLEGAKISFPQWTVLVFAQGTASLTKQQLTHAMIQGHVASTGLEAETAIDALAARYLLEITQDFTTKESFYRLSASGRELFDPLRADVAATVALVTEGLSPEDLVAAERVLVEISQRANEALNS